MKRALLIVLAVVLAVPFTACMSRESNTSSVPSTPYSSSRPYSSTVPSTPSVPSAPAVPPSTPTMSTDFSQIGALDAEIIPWGWGPHLDDNNRSVSCQSLQEQYGKYGAFFIGPADERNFYLTFDEGYENGYTAKILDVLKEKNTPAVFFVTMHYVKSNPDLIQRMIDEGHIVGNHSTAHPNYTTISVEDAFEDIKTLHEYMIENYDYTMSVFRYPEGAFNEQTLAMLDQMGYRTAFWSFAYADWDPDAQMAYDEALERVKKYTHPGAIYLLHAVSSTNAEILPEYIDWLQGEGYTLCPFDLQKAAAE